MSGARVRQAGAAACAALVLLVGTGCGTDDDGGTDVDDPSSTSTAKATDELRSRPSYDEAGRGYQQLLTRVRAALAEVAPGVAWDTATPARGSETLCRAPFDDVEGARAANYATGGGGAIPDEDWPRAVRAVQEVVAPEGYGEPEVQADEPGRHAVSFYGPYREELLLTGQRSTSVTVLGGCFLGDGPSQG